MKNEGGGNITRKHSGRKYAMLQIATSRDFHVAEPFPG